MFSAWGAIWQGVNKLTMHIDRSLVCQQKINSYFALVANTIDHMKLYNFLFISKFFHVINTLVFL